MLNDKQIKILEKAAESFYENGKSQVKCDSCEELIIFQRKNEALFYQCKCGKFKGTLR